MIEMEPMMDTKFQTDKTILAPDLKLRSAQWDDVEAVAQLIYEVCEADGDTTVAVTPEELKLEWQTPGFNLDRDAFLVETPDGRIVGYEEFNNRHMHATLEIDGYVHPDFKGRGMGTSLLRTVEKRAHTEMSLAEPDLRVSLRSAIDSRDQASHDLHKNEGYQPLRYYWRMEINLASPLAPVTFPEEIELRPFVKDEHARAVLDAQNEAFRDHWGSHDLSYEQWAPRKFGREDFDPSLWMIAWDADQIAGFSQNRFRMGIGWIGTLGVRRPWRKRGLGQALLLHSFAEFYKRGTTTIGLGVDAQNPTGATRLYQKVGMYAVSEFVTYEKELRAGREIEE
jgi:mycothiol synthase